MSSPHDPSKKGKESRMSLGVIITLYVIAIAIIAVLVGGGIVRGLSSTQTVINQLLFLFVPATLLFLIALWRWRR